MLTPGYPRRPGLCATTRRLLGRLALPVLAGGVAWGCLYCGYACASVALRP